MRRKPIRRRRFAATVLAPLIGASILVTWAAGPAVGPAAADSYVPVSGAGSSWSANALDQWIADVDQYGMRVNYAPTGSSDGRHQFLSGTVDFAASDIPFQSHPEDGSAPEQPAAGSYAYMPITAGGTVFMYNLKINGSRVTDLRLSGLNVAKIFTGVITNWNDPAIAADNPGLTLPGRPIVPVVRSDGSGSTAQFTMWMISQYPSVWNAYCNASGRAPKCGQTSYYPATGNMVAQNGDLGVAGYVAQSYAEGAIGYVNYSYALNAHFPVAKVLNVAGYYTEPTPQNVAVSLLKAEVDTTDVNDPSLYLTQQLGGVYNDTDPRTYELSSYSYLILPTKTGGQFTTAKGKTLAAFSYYSMCQGQQESASLGYSPMPVNLVKASFDQITKIPGAVVQNINVQSCNNPTFSPTSPNLLADTAPMPPACDKQGPTQCTNGTAGATQATPASGGGAVAAPTSRGTGSPSAGAGSAGSRATTGGARAAGSGRTQGGTLGTASRTGQGSSTAAGTTGGVGATGGSSGAQGASCDPSSGNCSGSPPSADPSAANGGTQQLASDRPTTLPAHKGWTDTQTLMILVVLLLGALVLGPAIVARHLDRRVE